VAIVLPVDVAGLVHGLLVNEARSALDAGAPLAGLGVAVGVVQCELVEGLELEEFFLVSQLEEEVGDEALAFPPIVGRLVARWSDGRSPAYQRALASSSIIAALAPESLQFGNKH